jgi:phage-related protein
VGTGELWGVAWRVVVGTAADALGYTRFDLFMKEIRWAGSSYKDLCNFPVTARHEAGYQLYLVQSGLEPTDWKPMSGIGTGVREIRLHQGGEHRVIYVAKLKEGVYVLHAFEKKTQRTPKLESELAKSRLIAINEQKRRQ